MLNFKISEKKVVLKDIDQRFVQIQPQANQNSIQLNSKKNIFCNLQNMIPVDKNANNKGVKRKITMPDISYKFFKSEQQFNQSMKEISWKTTFNWSAKNVMQNGGNNTNKTE